MILGEDQVAEIEQRVDSGKLSLADLNTLAERERYFDQRATLIFGRPTPQGRPFRPSSRATSRSRRSAKKLKELRQLLQISFDIELPAAEALSNWRVRLGRHVMLTELFAHSGKQVP